MPPLWLIGLSVAWLALSVGSAIAILADLAVNKPMLMPIMRWVWPITALYMGPVAVWAYWRLDRVTEQQVMRHMQKHAPHGGDGASHGGMHGHAGSSRDMGEQMHEAMMAMKERQPFWQLTFKATTHCGSGCTIGDFFGEWIVFWAGWTFAGLMLWPEYIVDYALAYILGIAFQYFSIAPMRGLGLKDGIKSALQSDTLSLTTFEIGLFGWMALYSLVFLPTLHPDSVVYWFMMQVGMFLGFLTSVPMNGWLLRKGIKEEM